MSHNKSNIDLHMMRVALDIAREAPPDCPIGCIITMNGEILASSHNQVEVLQDPTAHAELLAIREACKALKTKYLSGAILYCTLEPCQMCQKAIELAKIDRVIFGAYREREATERDYKGEEKGGQQEGRLSAKVEAIGGILQEECALILRDFFASIRFCYREI